MDLQESLHKRTSLFSELKQDMSLSTMMQGKCCSTSSPRDEGVERDAGRKALLSSAEGPSAGQRDKLSREDIHERSKVHGRDSRNHETGGNTDPTENDCKRHHKEEKAKRKTWDERFYQLKAHKKAYGTASPPWKGIIHDKSAFASWAKRQRRLNKKSKLTKERKVKLDRIGFDWDPTGLCEGQNSGCATQKNNTRSLGKDCWEKMLDMLNDYLDRQEDRVFRSHLMDNALETWIAEQKEGLSRSVLASKENSIKRKKLVAIGFPFKDLVPAEKQIVERILRWDAMFRQLVQHKNDYGTLEFVQEDESKLKRWTSRQKSELSSLSKKDGSYYRLECRRRMERIEFPWYSGEKYAFKATLRPTNKVTCGAESACPDTHHGPENVKNETLEVSPNGADGQKTRPREEIEISGMKYAFEKATSNVLPANAKACDAESACRNAHRRQASVGDNMLAVSRSGANGHAYIEHPNFAGSSKYRDSPSVGDQQKRWDKTSCDEPGHQAACAVDTNLDHQQAQLLPTIYIGDASSATADGSVLNLDDIFILPMAEKGQSAEHEHEVHQSFPRCSPTEISSERESYSSVSSVEESNLQTHTSFPNIVSPHTRRFSNTHNKDQHSSLMALPDVSVAIGNTDIPNVKLKQLRKQLGIAGSPAASRDYDSISVVKSDIGSASASENVIDLSNSTDDEEDSVSGGNGHDGNFQQASMLDKTWGAAPTQECNMLNREVNSRRPKIPRIHVYVQRQEEPASVQEEATTKEIQAEYVASEVIHITEAGVGPGRNFHFLDNVAQLAKLTSSQRTALSDAGVETPDDLLYLTPDCIRSDVLPGLKLVKQMAIKRVQDYIAGGQKITDKTTSCEIYKFLQNT
jgi:dsDNA-binding SOS-regulon protein